MDGFGLDDQAPLRYVYNGHADYSAASRAWRFRFSLERISSFK